MSACSFAVMIEIPLIFFNTGIATSPTIVFSPTGSWDTTETTYLPFAKLLSAAGPLNVLPKFAACNTTTSSSKCFLTISPVIPSMIVWASSISTLGNPMSVNKVSKSDWRTILFPAYEPYKSAATLGLRLIFANVLEFITT